MAIFIEPAYKIESKITGEELKNIERYGRVCYKSEDKITEDSAESFVKMLIERGHESVLEHEKLTVRFICDRGISHELVRHRLASFSQESTRYCNYKNNGEIVFIKPDFSCMTVVEKMNKKIEWEEAMRNAEAAYMRLLAFGCTPQEARSVLPNSLKTEVVVTANYREWRTILKQRTKKDAHPQMQRLMKGLCYELKCCIPVIFDDIFNTQVQENNMNIEILMEVVSKTTGTFGKLMQRLGYAEEKTKKGDSETL